MQRHDERVEHLRRQRRSEPWFEPLRLRGTSWFRVEGLGLGVRLYTPRAW